MKQSGLRAINANHEDKYLRDWAMRYFNLLLNTTYNGSGLSQYYVGDGEFAFESGKDEAAYDCFR